MEKRTDPLEFLTIRQYYYNQKTLCTLHNGYPIIILLAVGNNFYHTFLHKMDMETM